MLIFENNSFSQDSLDLRTSRLLALKTNINNFAAPLSIPADMVNWALNAHSNWDTALGSTQVEGGEAGEAYQTMHEADIATFDYYLRCKALLVDRYGQGNTKLKIYGVEGAFSENRKGRLKAVKDLLDGNTRLVAGGDPNVLPAAFISILQTRYDASNNAFANLVLKEKEESLEATDAQNTLFDADSKRLRVLYSWTLMTWEDDAPQLLLLGFAPRTAQPGGGQPDAPTGLAYNALTNTFSWDVVENATSYQLFYISIVNGQETGLWQEAYNGTDTSVVFNPGTGEWKFKVRARDAQGYGDWSEPLTINTGSSTTAITVDIDETILQAIFPKIAGNASATGIEQLNFDHGDGYETVYTLQNGNLIGYSISFNTAGVYHAQLTELTAGAFGKIGVIQFDNCKLSGTLTIPTAVQPSNIEVPMNPLLTAVNMQQASYTNVVSFVVHGCGLLSVNEHLIGLDNSGKTNGFANFGSGTNAAPSGQGIAAKNSLIAKGWTVITN